ncbi:peptidylprolyl isomerase [Limnohabitans sp.]|uniref:peptidylprolyl isomerase n=1 Tax=Limnohabitans sp. TaxID=1907725 RepID=UPI00286EE3AC|nr:peptidylprolyl isomerase [Limnohabitans sp.]
MKKTKVIVVMLASLFGPQAVWSAPKGAADKLTTEVARVNDEGVSVALFELALKDQLQAGAQDSAALRDSIRTQLVLQTFVAQQALKQRLDKGSDVQLRIELARKSVLATAWQQQWLQDNPVSDAEVQSEYAALVTRSGDKEYQIRQVVLRDETSARLVLDQLKGGKKLDELARTYSIDAASKADGGLVAWVNPAALIAPLGEVVVKAKIGQLVADPVKTAAGWHVLELVGERPFTLPPLAQIKPQLQQSLAQRKLEAAIQADVNKAKIELR